MNTIAQGTEITAIGRSRSTGRSIGCLARIPASNRIAASLANSDGWMLKPPIEIQRWAPRALVPTSFTASKLTSVAM